ncbi:MAG: two pore domain potassium channel family protein [Chloroflexi bacterium]|nr:two pore domain potassium channel family protein [Chloroflexota bacterium]
MIALYVFIVSLFRKIRQGWKDSEFRGLFWMVLTVLLMGTIFYHLREGWSWLDSFYFTVVTLATVGYGDLAPTRPESKIFTVLYIIIGLGLLSSFIVKLANVTQVPIAERPLSRLISSRSSDKEEEDVEETAVNKDNTNP